MRDFTPPTIPATAGGLNSRTSRESLDHRGGGATAAARVRSAFVTSNPGGRRPLHILATVNFNDNQLRAHLLPLLQLPEVAGVTLVADAAPGLEHRKLRVVVPPRLLTRTCSRAGAKLLVCLALAIRHQFDWAMGFHFLPHGLNVRVVEALTKTKSLYHMIGGPKEWMGGGWQSENRFLARLPRPSRTLEQLFVRLIVRGAAVAAMGEAGRATLIDWGAEPARAFVIPPGVETAHFASAIADGPRYDVITVGQLVQRKRTDDLLRAVAALRPLKPDITAAVVGDGPRRLELQRFSEKLDIDDRIEFLGFRTDVAPLYASTKVFALMSDAEGLPVSMLEAMASGVACVVPAVGEIPGFVRDGESALLFEPGDVDSLVALLGRLLDDEPLRTAVGAAGARLVRARASVESVARAYGELLASFR